MEWGALILLLGIGFVMVVLEFLVFPGTNIVGLIGVACIGCGIYLGYRFFGTATGHGIVLGTATAGVLLTWYTLRTQTWKKLSLHTQIDSKVEGVDPAVKTGDTGITVGRLAPMGKVRVGESVVEALSESGYIETNRKVEILKVYTDKVIVKLKTEEHGQ
ncbi:MAG: hypothetical protein NC410_06350 [Oscillibacter sp.]|nr:hypothetical protein [Oscillibacter sp.]